MLVAAYYFIPMGGKMWADKSFSEYEEWMIITETYVNSYIVMAIFDGVLSHLVE